MNLVLFGPPGAGKGTQSDNITKDYNLFKVSTGDLLRDEIKKKTNLGNKIKILIDSGKFVSDEIINDLIKKIISNPKNHDRMIFDGYPRNLNQAKTFDILLNSYNLKIDSVLNLEVDKDILIKRITGRSVCSKCKKIFNDFFNPPNNNHSCLPRFLVRRPDDKAHILENRLKTYFDDTFPVLNYYKKKNILHNISASSDIGSIYKEIKDLLVSLNH
ncbi:MAG: adenylate kinase [Candidatus Pelagibacter sp. TMED64]|nr:adenylate kinase [Candidatus Pelagibacter sp.]OUU67096.1 MAG: adenylate kinase [Candidatus Pelagibacter sp. TMED64]|tara:strand:- start:2378 stop:3025 length:648 start_codon:yes stop_codon:yes gene_type:complete